MTPEQAVFKIKNSINGPLRGDRWSLKLWKRWRKNHSKGMRIPEYEEIIAQDFDCLFWYATNIVRNKLPKKLHNLMVSYGIANPDDQYVKIYFDVIEKA